MSLNDFVVGLIGGLGVLFVICVVGVALTGIYFALTAIFGTMP